MKPNIQIAEEIEARPENKNARMFVADSWVLTCEAMDAARREGFEEGFCHGMDRVADHIERGFVWEGLEKEEMTGEELRDFILHALRTNRDHWLDYAEAAFQKVMRGV